MREFMVSPSTQLYRENLMARGIIQMSSRETFSDRNSYWFCALQCSYVELFWVYFLTPVTEAQKTQISELKGIREPAFGIGCTFGRTQRAPSIGILGNIPTLVIALWVEEPYWRHWVISWRASEPWNGRKSFVISSQSLMFESLSF
jgi:hypothetical protein